MICGNVVRDITPGGWAPGGTAIYAATVALALGRRVGVLTAAPLDVVAAGLPGAGLPESGAALQVARAETAEATSFENVYAGGCRTQFLRAPGSAIPASALPERWRDAAVTLVGPVFHEVEAELAGRFHGLVGVCAQGFLRRAAADGRVSLINSREWDAAPVLRGTAALFLSEEDLAGGERAEPPEAWLRAVPLTVVTHGSSGARVFSDGRWQFAPAYPAAELDPTGAGDSFAAAFMVALSEGATPLEAARFAAAVASIVVETRGPGAPTRAAIVARQQTGSAAVSSHPAQHESASVDAAERLGISPKEHSATSMEPGASRNETIVDTSAGATRRAADGADRTREDEADQARRGVVGSKTARPDAREAGAIPSGAARGAPSATANPRLGIDTVSACETVPEAAP